MSEAATATDTTSDDSAIEDAEAQELLADASKDEKPAPLGDAGKQAIDRMKAERNAARAELGEFKKLNLDPKALSDLIAKSSDAIAAAQAAQVKQDAEAAALAKANQRLVRAEVRAAATGKFQNPGLALQLLDMSTFDVGDDGEVDTDAINSALADLLEKEPYLGVTQGDGKRFRGTADSGAKGTAGKPQLSQADVKRMYAAGKAEEIETARKEGRLNDLLGIK